MKNLCKIFLLVLTCSLFACSTPKSIEMAQNNDTKVYCAYPADKAQLKSAVLKSLMERNWDTKISGDTILATLNKGVTNAKLSITIKDNQIEMDSAGSTLAGEPFVPLRYINFLKKSIQANLK